MTVDADSEERLDVPRHDLIRGLTPMRAEQDGNVMVGYPIVFNQWTEIDSWEGRFLERVLPSGPVKSMKETRQRVQYNHGMHPVVGTSGLGKPAVMKRDSVGVYTETPLSDTSYNRDIIKPLLADGTLDGMSFRFSVIEDTWKKPKAPTDWNPEMLPERSLVEFKWYEFGPVDAQAYEAATAGIRSQAALALWLQTPQEARSELMRQFDISVPQPRIVVPGWISPKTTAPPAANTAALLVRQGFTPESTAAAVEHNDLSLLRHTTQQDPPAGDDATGTTASALAAGDDSGPVDDTTRDTDVDDDSTTEPPPIVAPTRATPPPLSPERRESQRGALRAWIATVDSKEKAS